MSTRLLLNEAIERQNRIWSQMQEIRARAAEREDKTLTAEERAAWDKAEAELDEASRDIKRFERDLERETRKAATDLQPADPNAGQVDAGHGDADKRYADAFNAYLRRGMSGLNPEQRELLSTGYAELPELRAQSSGADPEGGFLVPEGFRQTMTETLKAYGGLLQVVEVITTATGQDLPWVTNDDTGNEGEIISENEEIQEGDVQFGGRRLKAHIFSSRMVKVPRTLLMDSAFDLAAWLPRKLGERIGRRAARAWTTGTGVDEPEGLVTNGTVGKTGGEGQTTTITYEDLIDVEHSVDPAYRTNAMYVFHDKLLKTLRKLVDGEDRPIWVPVPAAGFPATINGYPYLVDNSMPEPAASAKSLAFGDFRAAYVVRNVLGVQTLRLDERYAERLQVAFLGFARMDGMVQDPSAYRLYQHPAA